jgi:hypothetical protein
MSKKYLSKTDDLTLGFDADESKRTKLVCCRLNKSEYATFAKNRGVVPQHEWVRMCVLRSMQPVISIENRELYMRLNKLLGAVGSIIKNDQTLTLEQEKNLSEIKDAVKELQRELVGKN